MDEKMKQYFINGKWSVLNDAQNLKWLESLFRTIRDLMLVPALSEQNRSLSFKNRARNIRVTIYLQ